MSPLWTESYTVIRTYLFKIRLSNLNYKPYQFKLDHWSELLIWRLRKRYYFFVMMCGYRHRNAITSGSPEHEEAAPAVQMFHILLPVAIWMYCYISAVVLPMP
jgi:hypothetical protein